MERFIVMAIGGFVFGAILGMIFATLIYLKKLRRLLAQQETEFQEIKDRVRNRGSRFRDPLADYKRGKIRDENAPY